VQSRAWSGLLLVPVLDNGTFVKAAEACHKASFAFGIGFGTMSNSVDSTALPTGNSETRL
jgi:hypothetical protein